MFERMKIQLPDALKDIDNDGVYENLKVLWDLVQNRPSTFPPASHTHNDSDLLGIDWSKVLNKPSAFPPSSHQHQWADILSAPINVVEAQSYSGLGNTLDLTHITIEEGYYLWLFNTAPQGYGGAIYLLPNGNSYTGQFQRIYRNWNGSDQNGVDEVNSEDYFNICGNSDNFSIIFISTYTAHKSIISFAWNRATSGAYYYQNYHTLWWGDTSTPWSSFGVVQYSGDHVIGDFQHLLIKLG